MAPAICAPGRPAMGYAALWRQVQDVSRQLRELGIGRTDRLALLMPGGPEMAAAFLAACSTCVAVPLNPKLAENELGTLLSDLEPALVMTMSLPALKLQVPVLTLAAANGDADPAGTFSVTPPGSTAAVERVTVDDRRVQPQNAHPDDIALLLSTSGTTSRPKLVPLTHGNLCSSAASIASTLQLTSADRCLGVLPLFHIHGLVAALLASLLAGGGTCCTPGISAGAFSEWLESCRPTWYTAVPAIHQAVLSSIHAREPRSTLRLIRSSSAPLPLRILSRLEETFGVPVIEAYGMTEASHQVASNPLPPLARKPGSVGLPAGPEVIILDSAGSPVRRGDVGEVAVRGPGVMAGYLDNPLANASAFSDGWFRTGDLGRFDDDGYLFLQGRLKEVINRGGEKVNPFVVDRALLEHPGVSRAATFAVAHPTLGEDVACAVVPRSTDAPSEAELRSFLFDRLSAHEVPSRLLVVSDIPSGPTGKVQRRLLAAALSDQLQEPYVAPRDSLERTLAGLWEQMLDLPRVGINDNFFSLGGDSLQGTRLTARIRAILGVELAPGTLFRSPTISDLAQHIRPCLDPSAATRPAASSAEQGSLPRTPPASAPVIRRAPLEQELAALAAAVLNLPGLGVDDNLLVGGAESLELGQLLIRVQQVYGVTISLRAFFQAPTIAGLAKLIEQNRGEHGVH